MARNRIEVLKAFPIKIISCSGRRVDGKYVETSDGENIERKIFIPISNKKELVIKNLTLPLTAETSKNVATEVTEYVAFLIRQANLEFPEWIRENGTHAGTKDLYTEKDIEYNWKLMKSLFGRFRMAVTAGFITSPIPCKAELIPVTDILIKD